MPNREVLFGDGIQIMEAKSIFSANSNLKRGLLVEFDKTGSFHSNYLYDMGCFNNLPLLQNNQSCKI